MSRKVIITIDVEAQPGRATESHIERLIYGRFADRSWGIGKMFDIADRYGIQLTCFFDFSEDALHGRRWLNVAKFIQARGHDLQLHLHPEFMGKDVWAKYPGERRDDMFCADDQTADFLASFLMEQYGKVSESRPVAFRGGGYRFNAAMLASLAKAGVRYNYGYNANRINQPFNRGPLPPFQWSESGVIEIPVACLPKFMGAPHYAELNFNSEIFPPDKPDKAVENLNKYLTEYFRRWPDGAAAMVMHSWSLLRQDENKRFIGPNTGAAEMFERFCSLLAERYSPVSAARLAAMDYVGLGSQTWRPNRARVATEKTEAYACPVCDCAELEDYNGIEKRRCPECGAVERQRAFSIFLEKTGLNLSDKKILMLSNGSAERRILQRFPNAEIITLDIRPDQRPDIVGDICNLNMIANQTFDAIIGCQVLSHVYDLPNALSELARTLKEDGVFLQNDDSIGDAETREVVNEAEITGYYGKENFEKYRIGRFRIFGELNLDSLFHPFFERDYYEIEDPATGKNEIWNIWRKVSAPDRTAVRAKLKKPDENVGADRLAEDEWLFFESQFVHPGQKAVLHGRLKIDKPRELAIARLDGALGGILEIKGALDSGQLELLDARVRTGSGSFPIAQVDIPADLAPGPYLLDNTWLFFVSGPARRDGAVVVLPIYTMQMFSDFGGVSYYSSKNFAPSYVCSLNRPLGLKNLADIRIKPEALVWLQKLLQDGAAWIGDHELPSISPEALPRLVLIPGRSEWWTNEACGSFAKLLQAGVNFLLLASEMMYGIIHPITAGAMLKLNKRQGKTRDASIRADVGCNPFDGGFISNAMYADKNVYGSFTVLDSQNILFAGADLNPGDVVNLCTAPYDGLPLSGYQENGWPVLDMEKLSSWQEVSLCAFSMGRDTPEKRIGAMAYLNSGKGKLIHFGSLSWVDTAEVFSDPAHPGKRIMANAVNWLARENPEPFHSKRDAANDGKSEGDKSLCPICGNLLTAFDNGQNCPVCGSRARVRSLHHLLNDKLKPLFPDLGSKEGGQLLGFSMSSMERKLLGGFFQDARSVSLYGSYGADCETGVDVRDLSRYDDESFAAIYGCGLFDYFTEHEKALAECMRALKPGGLLILHIMPHRLKDNDEPPAQTGTVTARPGSFQYLGENTMPSIKVGKIWFENAVRDAGFELTSYTMPDPSGVESVWFVAQKKKFNSASADLTSSQEDKRPDKAAPANNTEEISVAPGGFISREREVFSAPVTLAGGKNARLSIDLLEPPKGSLHFLEDRLPGYAQPRTVTAADGERKRLYQSFDGGKSWRPHPANGFAWDSKIRSYFSLNDGGSLVRSFSGRMYHFDADGKIASVHDTGEWRWHGSQGIGQSANGIVMYAENAPMKGENGLQSVWKYDPAKPDEGWRIVLSLSAAVCPPAGEIRHFHVCRPLTSRSGSWLLASGDKREHCAIWLSEDDGENWQKFAADEMKSDNFPPARAHPLRFTQFAELANGELIWGTDDVTEGWKAAIIKFNPFSSPPALEYLTEAGGECIRNCIDMGDGCYAFLTESTWNTKNAYCAIFDLNSGKLERIPLPNIAENKSAFTWSHGSPALHDNMAFLPVMGSILVGEAQRGIFRLRVSEA